MNGHMSDEDHLKDEVWRIATKGDSEELERLVEKYGHDQVSSAYYKSLQKAQGKVVEILALSYRFYKKGLAPEEFCEKNLKDIYDQLDDKSYLIPSLDMLKDEEGATYYKRLFLKFLQKDNISL
jgi:hypothetical protein